MDEDLYDLAQILFEKVSDLGHGQLMIDEQVANGERPFALTVEGHRISRQLKLRLQNAEAFPVAVDDRLGIP